MIENRRILYMILVIILTFSVIVSGCSYEHKAEDLNSNKLTRVKFWVWDKGNNSQARNAEMFNITHDDIKIDLEVVAWDNYHYKLMTALSSGSGPDVCNMPESWIPEFVDMNALVQLDDLLKEWSDKEDVYDNLWTIIKDCTAGKTYAIPEGLNIYYLYCRKDLFQMVGTLLPETVDQFYDACKKLTMDTNGDGKIDVYGFGMRGTRMGHMTWMGITFSDGPQKTVLFDNAGSVVLNNPQVVKANQKYIDLYKKGYVPRTAPKDGINEVQQNFFLGVTAMYIDHMNAAQKMYDKYKNRLAIIPIPRGQAGRVVPMEMVVNGILKTSSYKKESFEVMKWWHSTDSNDFLCRNIGYTTVLKSVARLQSYRNNAFAQLSMDSFPDTYLISPTPEMGQWVEDTWPEEFKKALLGQSSSEQFIENISDGLKPLK